MKPEIFESAIGSYIGGNHWKNAVFPAQLVVTATKSNDLDSTHAIATLTATCSTPGVSYEWDYLGSAYDFIPVTDVFIAGVYTVIVSKAGYQSGQFDIEVFQLP